MTNILLANVSPAAPVAADMASSQSQISVSTALLLLIAIGVLWCCAMLVELRRRIDALETVAPSQPHEPVDSSDNIPDEIVAAISAAVISTCGRGVRIVRMAKDQDSSLEWSHEGRRTIFQSHKVR